MKNEIPVIQDHRRCLHGLSMQMGDVHHWDHPADGRGLISASWWEKDPMVPTMVGPTPVTCTHTPLLASVIRKDGLEPSVTGTGRDP